ncbi:hypothetical protein EYF80_019218 [Liparis tanakae]|uniref:Uncharacterized protein n=1 Tax=Liparis tanakae TaxID=230148 RepID=A0A4Z2HZU0_9TELE|nr:hypothetical protein EYF80_019218 [Liparis tanakae]
MASRRSPVCTPRAATNPWLSRSSAYSAALRCRPSPRLRACSRPRAGPPRAAARKISLSRSPQPGKSWRILARTYKSALGSSSSKNVSPDVSPKAFWRWPAPSRTAPSRRENSGHAVSSQRAMWPRSERGASVSRKRADRSVFSNTGLWHPEEWRRARRSFHKVTLWNISLRGERRLTSLFAPQQSQRHAGLQQALGAPHGGADLAGHLRRLQPRPAVEQVKHAHLGCGEQGLEQFEKRGGGEVMFCIISSIIIDFSTLCFVRINPMRHMFRVFPA